MAVVLALFIRTFVVQAFKIPSGSMLPTLQIGDHLLVNKFLYGIRIPVVGKRILAFRAPQRDDVIVFVYPQDPAKDFIKRVKGLPGETIEIRNKVLFVNGEAVEDDNAYYEGTPERMARAPRDNFGPFLVPDGHGVRDGRQPGPQPRQPFLGHRADRRHPRQGVRALLELGFRGVQPAVEPAGDADSLTVRSHAGAESLTALPRGGVLDRFDLLIRPSEAGKGRGIEPNALHGPKRPAKPSRDSREMIRRLADAVGLFFAAYPHRGGRP